jgi:signal recognition particle receptor subunit alpha
LPRHNKVKKHMIESVVVLTKGGLVLWSHTEPGIKGNPINTLIRSVLLEDRTGARSFNVDQYTIKWALSNDVDLIFVIVYTQFVQSGYNVEEEVLEIVRDKFSERYKSELQTAKQQGQHILSETVPFAFDSEYKNIVRAVELRANEKKEAKKSGAWFQEQQGNQKYDKKDNHEEEKPIKKLPTPEPEPEPISPTKTQPAPDDKISKLKALGVLSRKDSKKQMKTTPQKSTKPVEPIKHTKEARTWNTQDFSSSKASKLDRSSVTMSEEEEENQKVELFKKQFMPNPEAKTNVDEDIIDGEDEDDFDINDYQKKDTSGEVKKKSVWGNIFATLTNNRTLDESDLEPVMNDFKRLLQAKNVAAEIADNICKSVTQSLVGQKLGAFQAVKSAVNQAMEEALTRILTPRRNIDILRDAYAARDTYHRPYVITFCGVNGVGKSTSLSKICFWLLQNKLSVLFAACDTFRSGAVEQLKVHAKCLGVEVFDRKYGKEPALVARDAIAYAKKNKIDVVLVDTAGRMQDNEPLMRILAKLIQMNRPDLVLFVGEALVGNDGVDQLQKFNDSLSNLASIPLEDLDLLDKTNSSNTGYVDRKSMIDGIVLTKFDTIDDKVGAAISMVYKTGHPIVFVGVGQTYTDLKKLSVRAVVKSLLK